MPNSREALESQRMCEPATRLQVRQATEDQGPMTQGRSFALGPWSLRFCGGRQGKDMMPRGVIVIYLPGELITRLDRYGFISL